MPNGVHKRRFTTYEDKCALLRDIAWLEWDGWSRALIARSYGVSKATVGYWLGFARVLCVAEGREVKVRGVLPPIKKN